MNNIKYVRTISLGRKILSTCLFLVGLYCFVSTASIFGTILIFCFGSCLLLTFGNEIDLDNDKYREVYSLFGVSIGKWKPLPLFNYISIFKTNKRQIKHMTGEKTHINKEVFEINAFYNTNQHICFYRGDTKEDAFKVANHYSLMLKLRILDSTVTPSIWRERNTSFE
ncbi:MAG: hypothetical protein LBI72_00440 [Flavobacteriaceae bacterium]|jgi:hypothetical protein|nr:hypothetical protein [Flavobacteriaceae bacterium]